MSSLESLDHSVRLALALPIAAIARAAAVAGDAGSAGRTLDAGGARARLLAHARDLASRAASVAQAGAGRLRRDSRKRPERIVCGRNRDVVARAGRADVRRARRRAICISLPAARRLARSFSPPASFCPTLRWRCRPAAGGAGVIRRRGSHARGRASVPSASRAHRGSGGRRPVADGQHAIGTDSRNPSTRRRCVPHIVDAGGHLRLPFVYPLRLETVSSIATARIAPADAAAVLLATARFVSVDAVARPCPGFRSALTHSGATSSRGLPRRPAVARRRARRRRSGRCSSARSSAAWQDSSAACSTMG